MPLPREPEKCHLCYTGPTTPDETGKIWWCACEGYAWNTDSKLVTPLEQERISGFGDTQQRLGRRDY